MHRLSVVARQTVVSLELGVLADRVHRDCFVLSNHRILPSKGHLLGPPCSASLLACFSELCCLLNLRAEWVLAF